MSTTEATQVAESQGTKSNIDPNFDMSAFQPPAVETVNTEVHTEVTPPVNEPVVQPPVTEPVATPPVTFNVDEFVKELGVTSVDELKTKWTDLNTKVLPEYEQLKSRPEISDMAKYVDDLAKKGVDLKTIAQYHDIKPEAMDADAAIKLATKLQNKGWEDRHVEADFANRFGVDDTLMTETEITLREAAKIKAASEARQFLGDFIGKTFNPQNQVDNVAQEEAQRKAADFWNTQTSAIAGKARELEIPGLTFKTFGEKGEVELPLDFKYALSDNDLKAIQSEVAATAIAAGIDATPEGIAQMNEFFQNQVWAKKGPAIAKALLDVQATKFTEMMKQMMHNPTLASVGGKPVDSGNSRESSWLNKAKREATNLPIS